MEPNSTQSDRTVAATAARTLGIEALQKLALNLHWSWNHAADELWVALDSYQWERTQNPWAILQTVSEDKVKTLLATPDFQGRLSALLQRKRTFFPADRPPTDYTARVVPCFGGGVSVPLEVGQILWQQR